MEPQVWMPWLISILAPAALLVSQWLGTRDRSKDRKQALELDERAENRAVLQHWRDRRLQAHGDFLAVAREALAIATGAVKDPSTSQWKEHHRLYDALPGAVAAVELLASDECASKAGQLATRLRWSLTMAGIYADDSSNPEYAKTMEGLLRQSREAMEAYLNAARVELGTTRG